MPAERRLSAWQGAGRWQVCCRQGRQGAVLLADACESLVVSVPAEAMSLPAA